MASFTPLSAVAHAWSPPALAAVAVAMGATRGSAAGWLILLVVLAVLLARFYKPGTGDYGVPGVPAKSGQPATEGPAPAGQPAPEAPSPTEQPVPQGPLPTEQPGTESPGAGAAPIPGHWVMRPRHRPIRG